MFISKFSVENWKGNQNNGSLEEANDWDAIEVAIRELDGHRKTLVTLETDGEMHMAIGGGRGRYLVYITLDNQSFQYLVNPAKPNRDEPLVMGGQEGIYPARSCVDLATTLRAAKAFAEFGKLEPSVTWEQDGVAEPV